MAALAKNLRLIARNGILLRSYSIRPAIIGSQKYSCSKQTYAHNANIIPLQVSYINKLRRKL